MAWFAFPFPKLFTKKEPEPLLKTGDLLIDVSHHNGNIRWNDVKNDPQNIKGVMIRVSQGATLLDKKFYDNVKGATSVGLLVGFYHFATWNDEDEVRDATNEAKFYLSLIKGCGHVPELPVVLDIESNKPIPYTKDEMVTYVDTFTSIVNNEGFEPAIYGSPGFLNSYLPKNHPFTGLKLWVADYTLPINPVPGWQKAWLHQYTEKGKVRGISTNVDMNRVV